MLVCVCLILIQIHISEPIWTKPCTHLPLGLEETVGMFRPKSWDNVELFVVLRGFNAGYVFLCSFFKSAVDFGPVVKPLVITVKKAVQNVVETFFGGAALISVVPKVVTRWSFAHVTRKVAPGCNWVRPTFYFWDKSPQFRMWVFCWHKNSKLGFFMPPKFENEQIATVCDWCRVVWFLIVI
jgi:hypothetical protein